MSEIRTAHQSPLNPKRWEVELSCGHTVWITSTRRPKRNVACTECYSEQKEAQAKNKERKTNARR